MLAFLLFELTILGFFVSKYGRKEIFIVDKVPH